ncbi:hypothetical protein [Noviherbaspirillum sp.]|uniref:hypothetical protein n=1 Tax=Noviherbaspirillum sp. TaxID=1926288 RepID=UPI002D3273FF|nr:hypothetical protein [Noviherbaspirillum sp.]HZW22418.1 hypothetical protein [Noviherbaspirillum sp.]
MNENANVYEVMQTGLEAWKKIDKRKFNQSDPNKLAQFIHDFAKNSKAAWSQYLTRPELAQQIVAKVTAASISDKGTPALFDALDKVRDPDTGLTIADSNAELAVAIASGRKTAEKMHDQRIERDAQPALLKELLGWKQQVAQGQLVPVETLAASIGPGKQFASHEAAAAFDHWQREQIGKNDDLATALQLYDEGMGYLLTPKQQKGVSEHRTAPLVTAIISAPNQAVLNEAAANLADMHTRGQLTIPNETLKRFIDGLTAVPMDQSGVPNPRFLAAAALYKSFPDNVRKLYFSEDADTLFRSYTKETANGVDPGSAYKGAYTAISPEAKAQMQEITKHPEWQAGMSKTVQKVVDGLQYQPSKDFIPFRDNLPANLGLTSAAATAEAKRFMLTHPDMGEEDVKAHVESWVQSNYVHDTKTNLLVGVPPSVGQTGNKVITYQQEKLLKQYGEDSRPTLVYLGNGNYQIQTMNPVAIVGTTTWDSLKKDHSENTSLTDADRASLSSLHEAATKGTLTADAVNTYAPLLSKIRTLGLDDKIPMKAINDAHDKALRTALSNIPKLAIGGASSVVGPVPQALNDSTAQKEATLRFLHWGTSGMQPKLTEALITQGEGVVLRASPDPAGGAGMNIGMGYNLKANEGNIKEDFRKAGIPVEAIEDIKAGRKSITQDQAERLLAEHQKVVEVYTQVERGEMPSEELDKVLPQNLPETPEPTVVTPEPSETAGFLPGSIGSAQVGHVSAPETTLGGNIPLAHQGIEDSDVHDVLGHLKKYTTEDSTNGRVMSVDWERWHRENPDTYNQYHLAVERETRDAIQDHDLGETIPWSHTQLGKIFMELRTFISVAHAKNFLKNASYADKTTFSVWMYGLTGEALMYSLQTSLNFAHNKEELQKRLSLERIAQAAVQRASAFGMMPAVLSTGYWVGSGNDLFGHTGTANTNNRDLIKTPSGMLLTDLYNAPKTLAGVLNPWSETVTTKQEVRDLFSLLPFGNTYGMRNIQDYVSSQFPVNQQWHSYP